MTDRASFLAAVASTPRGDDPGLPSRSTAPDAPTELRAGEDPLDRFEGEATAVATIVERVTEAEVGDRVAAALRAAGVRHAAYADDLAPFVASVESACGEFALERYATIAGDRARVAALDATITGCRVAVAATGSIVTCAAVGRAAALVAPTHVCVVRADQVVGGLHDLFASPLLDDAGSLIALQAGPSRSADIEKTLILGVHGPGRVHVLLVV